MSRSTLLPLATVPLFLSPLAAQTSIACGNPTGGPGGEQSFHFSTTGGPARVYILLGFSTDGGVTYSLSTVAGSSPESNPTAEYTAPFSTKTIIWDTFADGVGYHSRQQVEVVMEAWRGGSYIQTCWTGTLQIDNRPLAAVNLPDPGAGDRLFEHIGASPWGAPTLTRTTYWSTDSGTTWNLASAAPTSPTQNPDVDRPAPYAGEQFVWDTVADGIAVGSSFERVHLLIYTDDGVTSPDAFTDSVIVDNHAEATFTSTGAGSTLAGDVQVDFYVDSTGDPVESTLQYSTDSGLTWQTATAAPGSALQNPDQMRATPAYGLSITWDTAADGVGLSGPVPTELRLHTALDLGAANFSDAGVRFLQERSSGIATGDFDGDGNLDVFTSYRDGTPAAIWLGDGLGGFSMHTTSFPAVDAGMALAVDVDADLDVDIVVCDFTAGATVYLNDGAGTFAFGDVVGSPAVRAIAARDVNGDGHVDLVTGEVPSTGGVFLGNGAGQFGASAQTLTSGVLDVELADVDLDGDLDLIEVPAAGPTRVRINDGAGMFGVAVPFAGQGVAVAAGDLDGDGDIDVVVGTPVGSATQVVLGDGAGGFAAPVSFGAPISVQDVLLVDLDLDGVLDVCLATVDGPEQVWLGDGAGGFAPGNGFGNATASRLAAGDFDGDGDLDIAVAALDADRASRVFLNGNTRGIVEVATGPMVENHISCAIGSPSPGAVESETVAVAVDATASAGMVDVSFEYSLDGGATWLPATPAAGSALANPQSSVPTPATGVTFLWDTVADGVLDENVDFRLNVAAGSLARTCEVSFVVNSLPVCAITAPAAGSLHGGDVLVTFDGSSPAGSMLTSTFEFSTDAGTSWQLATAAATSPIGNPDPLRASPFTGVTFLWDTVADGVLDENVDFRLSIAAGPIARSCEVSFVVDSLPACAITGPAAGSLHGEEVLVTFDGSSPSGSMLTSTFEFSTDGGATWQLAAAAAASPIGNPDPLRVTPFTGVTFLWDTVADGVGALALQPTRFRVTADTGVPSSECEVAFDVDHSALCRGICGDCDLSGGALTIIDSLRAAQISVGLLVASPEQVGCCDIDSDSDIDILDALRVAQASSGLQLTLTCP